jgi:hypothetical protein
MQGTIVGPPPAHIQATPVSSTVMRPITAAKVAADIAAGDIVSTIGDLMQFLER